MNSPAGKALVNYTVVLAEMYIFAFSDSSLLQGSQGHLGGGKQPRPNITAHCDFHLSVPGGYDLALHTARVMMDSQH